MFPTVDFLLYALALSISPGPNCLLSMANASQVGLRKGIKLNFGMFAGILVNMTICFFAVKVLSSLLPKAELVMKIIAAAYMLYLAYKLLTSPPPEEKTASVGLSFSKGFLLQMVNPKVYMLGLSTVSSYIIPCLEGTLRQYLVTLSLAAICFVSGLIWAVGGALLFRFFHSHYKITNTIFALTLVYCVVRLFV